MLKSVKIGEDAYKAAKVLTKELERERKEEGIAHVGIGDAIGFAIMKTVNSLDKKKQLRSSAGSWKDLDTAKMITDIYKNRTSGRKDVQIGD